MWDGQPTLKSLWWRTFRTKKVVVCVLIMAVVALVLANLPLFNVLGYEFAFALALANAIPATICACGFLHHIKSHPREPDEQICNPTGLTFSLAMATFFLCAAPLLIPLLVISLNALRVQNCDWLFGIQTFLLMPVLSAFLLATLCLTVGLLFGRSFKWTLFLSIAFVLVSIALSLIHI